MGDGHWPVFIGVGFSDDSQRLLSVFLNFHADSLQNPDGAEAVRATLTSIEPPFAKNAVSRFRRIQLAREVSLAEALKVVNRVNVKLEAATVGLHEALESELG